MPKRLVAVGDIVYVTLDFHAPVTALDAATGEIIETYEDTEHVDEIICRDGRLILSIYHKAQAPSSGNRAAVRKSVCVVDTDSGKVLWKHGDYPGLRSRADAGEPFSRLELIAGERHAFLVDSEFLIALDLKTGHEVWRKTRPPASEFVVDRYGVRMSDQCVLVHQDGVVLLAQPEMKIPDSWHTIPGTLYAYSADTGELKWKYGYGGWSSLGQPDTFVINGLVWVHEHADVDQHIDGNKHVIANQDKVDYAILGLDLHTGKVKRRFSTSDTFNQTHHHRCYRGKATEKFVMPSRRGVEFLDLKTEENHLNRWVRGACLYGFVPANGLLYTTPHPCSCYSNEKLNGYFALAPEKQSLDIPSGEERLLKGPAYGKINHLKSKTANHTDWPTYRHDALRSGASPSLVPVELEKAWSVEVGGNLSPPVVADGKLFVSSIDEHHVSAIDASKGRPIWSFTAGGRVDTPPTSYRDLVLFGSADGWVYCLRGSDGQLVWKRRAAPIDRLIGAYGQLESAWPVHGSVLVENDKLYFAAGRSSFLDDGIFLFALDPATGNILEQDGYDSSEAQTRKRSAGDTEPATGTLPEILVSDGSSIYMRHTRVFGDEDRERAPHLYSTSGLRDESWFHKSTWKFGPFNAARLLVFDGESAYGVNAYASQTGPNEFVQNSQGSIDSLSHPGKEGYLFFAGDLHPVTPRKPNLPANRRRFEARWSARVPLRVSALVLAGPILFAAGSPDGVDPEDPLGAFEGRRGGELRAFSAKDGAQMAFYPLDAAPVWDGMAAANGRLFLSCVDGNVICYGAK